MNELPASSDMASKLEDFGDWEVGSKTRSYFQKILPQDFKNSINAPGKNVVSEIDKMVDSNYKVLSKHLEFEEVEPKYARTWKFTITIKSNEGANREIKKGAHKGKRKDAKFAAYQKLADEFFKED